MYTVQTRNLALRLNSQNRCKMMEFDTEELILVYLVVFVVANVIIVTVLVPDHNIFSGGQ